MSVEIAMSARGLSDCLKRKVSYIFLCTRDGSTVFFEAQQGTDPSLACVLGYEERRTLWYQEADSLVLFDIDIVMEVYAVASQDILLILPSVW